jgi:hypothetical protein
VYITGTPLALIRRELLELPTGLGGRLDNMKFTYKMTTVPIMKQMVPFRRKNVAEQEIVKGVSDCRTGRIGAENIFRFSFVVEYENG